MELIETWQLLAIPQLFMLYTTGFHKMPQKLKCLKELKNKQVLEKVLVLYFLQSQINKKYIHI